MDFSFKIIFLESVPDDGTDSKKKPERDFPRGPVVKTLPSSAEGRRLNPDQELRSLMLRGAAKKKKKPENSYLKRKLFSYFLSCSFLVHRSPENDTLFLGYHFRGFYSPFKGVCVCVYPLKYYTHTQRMACTCTLHVGP